MKVLSSTTSSGLNLGPDTLGAGVSLDDSLWADALRGARGVLLDSTTLALALAATCESAMSLARASFPFAIARCTTEGEGVLSFGLGVIASTAFAFVGATKVGRGEEKRVASDMILPFVDL